MIFNNVITKDSAELTISKKKINNASNFLITGI